ncbi:MAG TPA: response regulator, partial [Anaerolineales bacterium]|nr:response regulator [Anaerolineales bacterium]
KTVLVLQNDPLLRDLIRLTLKRAGCRVVACADLITGLGLLTAERPDLILVDLFLADEIGVSLVQRLRAAPAGGVPILAMSSLGFRDVVQQAVRAGADDFIVKPFEPDELIQRVELALLRAGAVSAETRKT